MSQGFKAHLALLTATIFFGINYWIAKGLMPVYFQPMQIVILRVSIVFLIFWILEVIFIREKIDRKDIFKFALCGLLGVSINQVMFFKGLYFSTPFNASLLHVINPMLVLVFASLIIKEKITLFKFIGILLGATGVVILISESGNISFSNTTAKGDIFILINLTVYALYLVIIKPLMQKYKPITVMKWVFMFGFIFLIPFAFQKIEDINWQEIPQNIIFSLLYVVIINTCLNYLLIIYSLKYVEASTASYYMYLQPIIVVIIGLFAGNAPLGFIKIIAAALIFAGVYLVSKKTRTNANETINND
jgi:drug/metabolite transporter (DMT)-like permease